MANLFPALLGLVSVLQAGLNRQVGRSVGWVQATVLNNVVLFLASLLLYWFTRPKGFAVGALAGGGRLPLVLYLLPGVLGLVLVAGIPAAIGRLGALQVFLPLIAAQILGSLLWDSAMEGIQVGWLRGAGAALTLVGTILISLGKAAP